MSEIIEIPNSVNPFGDERSLDIGLGALTDPSLDPLFWRAERLGAPSAWWLHVPFAHWIVCAARPNVLVELGTHAGVSYSAFCQAVQRAGLPTRCHAVDTWKGDAHAGNYDDSVFNEFNDYHRDQFSDFSTLMRCAFDEALGAIEDGVVDLLHIDGLHTYEAVRRDFESWLPKLSARAVVIFHDTNERAGDFGVWRLWQELCERYPSFSFLHGHGLGVLAVGERVAGPVMALCRTTNPSDVARIRGRFSRLGERWLTDTRERMMGQRLAEIPQLKTQLEELANAGGAAQAQELATARDAARAQEILRAEAVQRLEEARADATKARAEAAEARARVEAAEARTGQEAREQAEREAREQAEREARQQAEREISAAEADRKTALAHAAQVTAAAQELAHRHAAVLQAHQALLSSTAWRMTLPLRQISQRVPRRVRRVVRGGIKLSWWSVTLQLRSKLRQRRSLIAAASVMNPAVGSVLAPVPTSPPVRAIVYPPVYASNKAQFLVYVSGEPNTPGHLYRIDRYRAAATALGIASTEMRVEEIASRIEDIERATVLIIWRAFWSGEIEAAIAAARRGGARVVFDLDDLMVDPNLARTEVIDGIRSQHLTEEGVRGHYANVRTTMLATDMCFATTEELAFHMRLAGQVTYVLPNGFDQASHDLSRRAARQWRKNRPDNFIRIGYAGGSRTHQRDFGLVIEAVAKLLRENGLCRLVLFREPSGDVPLIDVEEYSALAGLEDRIEWRPLQKLPTLPLEMARFDINMAPLEYDNPFCDAKSELKFFEAALVDVPTIASPTGPFRRAIDHGRSGFLAANAQDWYVYLKQLADDPALRARIAHAAYHVSLARFGPMQRTLQLGRAIDQLHGGDPGARAFALHAHLSGQPRKLPTVYDSDIVFEKTGEDEADVTVVIPLYNYEGYIVEALDSVRAQTLVCLDLVIVDGHSTDNSLAVAKAWAETHAARFNRVAVLRNRANYGLGLCRNSGFDAAESPYVMLLDADNRLLPACCEKLLETVRASRAAYAIPTIQQFGASSALISNVPYVPQRFVAGNHTDAMALVSKEAWAIVGGYDHLRHGWEDYDFWARLAEVGARGEWRQEVLAEYRVHESSMMKQQTTIPDNYRRLMENFRRRHPWVSLVDETTARRIPKPDTRLSRPEAMSRLDTLLPILRCPHTKQKLAYSEDRTALVSVDGLRRWPIKEGRPVLSATLTDPDVKPREHISNPLPEVALDLIRKTKGMVLNLSAGGSREKFEHVVEVEYAIFRHTDLVADAHELPFFDETFDAVVVMNAFEHYRDPHLVAAELRRVLKPEGQVLIHTAFMQPLHERPWHFYNCTRHGLEEWFKAFETDLLHVSDNFTPNHSIAWLASECETALRQEVSAASADAFLRAPVGALVDLWRDPSRRNTPLWTDFAHVSQATQEITAAGFEFKGRKPADLPDLNA
ncbi:MAG TPA: glycosyltransferase [Acetobacteraceae bacterium]|nr:glycosyltransferase [Acetobacteraceae bacterium]